MCENFGSGMNRRQKWERGAPHCRKVLDKVL